MKLFNFSDRKKNSLSAIFSDIEKQVKNSSFSRFYTDVSVPISHLPFKDGELKINLFYMEASKVKENSKIRVIVNKKEMICIPLVSFRMLYHIEKGTPILSDKCVGWHWFNSPIFSREDWENKNIEIEVEGVSPDDVYITGKLIENKEVDKEDR